MELIGSSSTVKYECLLFDMDDTLYPMSAGLNFACRKNIEEFMLTHLNIEESQVPGMCLDLYREHGTTMAGLKVLGYKFDNDAFHAFVHGTLPYHALKPDLVLRNLLLSMPQRKIIFTNADRAHAAQVLNKLGLEDCFEGVICFETLNINPLEEQQNKINGGWNNSTKKCSAESPTGIICKPSLESFQAATILANINPKKTIFFDDSVRNIATAKIAGFHTVIGWMELAGARYSMGASRVNAVLLNHKHHSAATTVELDYHNAGSMTKSPQFSLRKWTSSDDKDLSFEKENIEEDAKLKESLSSRHSENQEHSTENGYESETNASPRESNGSETNESPRKTENHIQKERAKVLSVFGTLVSPKLRASQLSFETALETLVKLANVRSSILEAHNELQKDIKSTKE